MNIFIKQLLRESLISKSEEDIKNEVIEKLGYLH